MELKEERKIKRGKGGNKKELKRKGGNCRIKGESEIRRGKRGNKVEFKRKRR